LPKRSKADVIQQEIPKLISRAYPTAAANRRSQTSSATTTTHPHHQIAPKQPPPTTKTTSPPPTEVSIAMSATLIPMATLKMAERQKAFGFSYASLVGAVPSTGTADSTKPALDGDGAERSFGRDSERVCFLTLD
jgi:hypothetical protein